VQDPEAPFQLRHEIARRGKTRLSHKIEHPAARTKQPRSAPHAVEICHKFFAG
jgi:hypothetical protein